VRPAIALVELIVAIVIMAIAFTAIPIMMESSEQAGDIVIQQETIAILDSQLHEIAKMQWDEGETNETKNGGYAKILDTTVTSGGGNYARYPDTNSSFRIGAMTMYANEGKFRRRFYNSITMASYPVGAEESDETLYDDIDDYDGLSYSLSDQNATGYKATYDIDVDVGYHDNDILSHATPTGSTGIKVVTVRATSPDLDVNVSLKSFFCNIGETKILTRYVGP